MRLVNEKDPAAGATRSWESRTLELELQFSQSIEKVLGVWLVLECIPLLIRELVTEALEGFDCFSTAGNQILFSHWVGTGLEPTVLIRSDPSQRLCFCCFQQLWNEHNPDAPLVEDGIWGPATAAAVERSPAAGFPAKA